MSNANVKRINIKIIINTCIFLVILAVLVLTLGIYIKVYYSHINIETISNHLVVCINIMLKLVSKFCNNLLDSLLTEGNMKIIIIALAIIFSIYKFQLKDWINDITNIELNGFKLQKKVQALDDMNKTEQKNIEELEKEKDKEDAGDDLKEKIKLSKMRIDLLRTMIEDPYIVTVLERFVDKKIGALRIPMNIFKQNTSTESIGKIFEYDVSVGFVKIKGIKAEIKDIVYDIYIKIKNENKG
ncbi:MAG: hypothetical protein LLF98_06420 [Clostridium sp.]|uniref:hypothetical protein n=1 Tax=Clostridium sp. TaxID=1506 RepID=UPI0025C66801|nr:hypothetical protein [Clostridium sp.]MCE5220900.1 hypothetical protein [Clostridium sp.]